MLRALVVSNMLPDAAHPGRGVFVRDQVAALRMLDDVEIELFEFPPGAGALVRAARELHRRFGRVTSLDRTPARPRQEIVHAHFGLTAWPALAVPARVRALTVHGTDVRHPRTRLATAAVIPAIDLLAAASAELVEAIPGANARARAQVLPCGVDTGRFRRVERSDARERLGLSPDGRFLLFAADPTRPEKRHDRAAAVARECGAELLTLGAATPEQMPLWINAANAVLVPSEREGFGLAVLEALACDVPVLATPVGIHRDAIEGVAGALCSDFDLAAWSAVAAASLDDPDPRIAGRSAAERFSAQVMARRVLDAWRTQLAVSTHSPG